MGVGKGELRLLVLKGRKLAAGQESGTFPPSPQRCAEGHVHAFHSPLTLNEIGNNKFVFPGVMVYISMLHSHFTLKSFQNWFMGRERDLGFLPSF